VDAEVARETVDLGAQLQQPLPPIAGSVEGVAVERD
jgi:hypothetical protein